MRAQRVVTFWNFKFQIFFLKIKMRSDPHSDVSDYLSQRRVAEVQLREATTLARSIVENLNAGFYLRLRQEMFSGSQESAAKHSSLDDARTTLTAYRGRLAKYHGRVAHKLAGLIDRIELRGMPDAMRHERRVLVQVCEVLENVITAHHGAVDTFAQVRTDFL